MSNQGPHDKQFHSYCPRHDSYAYIVLSAVIIQLFEIEVGNKGVDRKPIERCYGHCEVEIIVLLSIAQACL